MHSISSVHSLIPLDSNHHAFFDFSWALQLFLNSYQTRRCHVSHGISSARVSLRVLGFPAYYEGSLGLDASTALGTVVAPAACSPSGILCSHVHDPQLSRMNCLSGLVWSRHKRRPCSDGHAELMGSCSQPQVRCMNACTTTHLNAAHRAQWCAVVTSVWVMALMQLFAMCSRLFKLCVKMYAVCRSHCVS